MKCPNRKVGGKKGASGIDEAHEHAQLIGGRANFGQVYPRELCRAVCSGIAAQKRAERLRAVGMPILSLEVMKQVALDAVGQEEKMMGQSGNHDFLKPDDFDPAKALHEDGEGWWATDGISGEALDPVKVNEARLEEINCFKSMVVVAVAADVVAVAVVVGGGGGVGVGVAVGVVVVVDGAVVDDDVVVAVAVDVAVNVAVVVVGVVVVVVVVVVGECHDTLLVLRAVYFTTKGLAKIKRLEPCPKCIELKLANTDQKQTINMSTNFSIKVIKTRRMQTRLHVDTTNPRMSA